MTSRTCRTSNHGNLPDLVLRKRSELVYAKCGAPNFIRIVSRCHLALVKRVLQIIAEIFHEQLLALMKIGLINLNELIYVYVYFKWK